MMIKPQKIIFILPTLMPGGAEKVMASLAGLLSRKGNKVLLCSIYQLDALMEEIDKTVSVKFLTNSNKSRNGLEILAALNFRKVVKDFSPDVVISTLPPANFINVLTSFLVKKRYKTVVREASTPSVFYKAKLKSNLLNYISAFFCRRADYFIAPSQAVLEDAIGCYGLARERGRVIPNPIEFEKIEKLASINKPVFFQNKLEGKVLIGIGRLCHEKGFDVLIEAFSLLKNRNCHLLILGEGELREKLEEQIKSLSLTERVHLIGFQKNPYVYLKNSDLFILSSRVEGQPNVLLQALSLGLPVVATDCPSGPRELIGATQKGLLVPVNDPKKLAEAIDLQIEKPILHSGLEKDLFSIESVTRLWEQLL